MLIKNNLKKKKSQQNRDTVPKKECSSEGNLTVNKEDDACEKLTMKRTRRKGGKPNRYTYIGEEGARFDN